MKDMGMAFAWRGDWVKRIGVSQRHNKHHATSLKRNEQGSGEIGTSCYYHPVIIYYYIAYHTCRVTSKCI